MEIKKFNFWEIQKKTNPVFIIMFLGLIILSFSQIDNTIFGSFGIVVFAFIILLIGNYQVIKEIN